MHVLFPGSTLDDDDDATCVDTANMFDESKNFLSIKIYHTQQLLSDVSIGYLIFFDWKFSSLFSHFKEFPNYRQLSKEAMRYFIRKHFHRLTISLRRLLLVAVFDCVRKRIRSFNNIQTSFLKVSTIQQSLRAVFHSCKCCFRNQ